MSSAHELLDCVEIETLPGACDRAVVWMHGLGASGHDFPPIVPELGLGDLGVRFVFPHAPAIPVTINGGMVMPAWYDIRQLDLRREHDLDGVRASAERVAALVRRENERGVPTDRIVLAGFSQGGAVALWLGLRYPEKLAGIVGLSTYLIGEDLLDAEASPHAVDVPVFLAHGTQDPMVTHERGTFGREALSARGFAVEWHDYPMQHQVCLEEIEDLGRWLRGRLA